MDLPLAWGGPGLRERGNAHGHCGKLHTRPSGNRRARWRRTDGESRRHGIAAAHALQHVADAFARSSTFSAFGKMPQLLSLHQVVYRADPERLKALDRRTRA